MGNPVSLPVILSKHSNGEVSDAAPGRRLIALIPHSDLPENPLPGNEFLSAFVEDQMVFEAGLLPGVPKVSFLPSKGIRRTGCNDPVGSLRLSLPGGFKVPTQAGNLSVKSTWIGLVLAGQFRDLQVCTEQQGRSKGGDKYDQGSHGAIRRGVYLAAIAREQQVTWLGKHLLRHIGHLRRPPKSRRPVQKNTCRSFDRQALKNDLGSENLVHPYRLRRIRSDRPARPIRRLLEGSGMAASLSAGF